MGLNFDGTDDFVDMNNPSNPWLSATGDWTVAAWLFPETATTQTALAQYESTAGNGRIIIVRMRDPGSGFVYSIFLGDDDTEATVQVDGSTAVVTDAWVHVAVTRNGNTFKLYVDAVEDASHTDTGTRDLVQNGNIIGARNGSGAPNEYNDPLTRFWDGFIANTVIIPADVGAQGVQTLRSRTIPYRTPDFWYPMDSESGTTLVDRRQNQDGSISGASWLSGRPPITAAFPVIG